MIRRILLAAFLACLVTGCKTRGSLTAGATGCGATEVDIVKSEYTREGVTTAWCAKCKGKMYHCVSNPDRSRVECKEANAWDACK
jgi:hypothetical protein